MSTFVIVPGARDTPATLEPLVEPLESAGHLVIIVDLPCDHAEATLAQYADAVRVALPDDLADVALVGYSFGGLTAARIAVEHPELPVVCIAAWIPRPGASVLDLFLGRDPFVDGDGDAGLAAFGGLIVSAGPGRCALNVDQDVAAADPAERHDSPESPGGVDGLPGLSLSATATAGLQGPPRSLHAAASWGRAGLMWTNESEAGSSKAKPRRTS